MATRNFVPRGDGEGSIGTTVKNWAGGFFQKLAVGAITTAVTVLTPAADANNQQPATTGWVRSQFQSILKTVLSAAGLKYNIAQNGYICFGALFGGLILQWGMINVEESEAYTYHEFPLNIKQNSASKLIVFQPLTTATSFEWKWFDSMSTNTKFCVQNQTKGAAWLGWVSFGS